MIIHCKKFIRNKIELNFKDNVFWLNGKQYNTLNEVFPHIMQLIIDTSIDTLETTELIIDNIIINNTTTEELWNFLNAIMEKAELERGVYLEIHREYRGIYLEIHRVYTSYYYIKSEEILERAKNSLNISIQFEFQLTFKNNMFWLYDKKYTTLNAVLKDINIKDENSELIINRSVIDNTTTEELWNFLYAIIETAELKEHKNPKHIVLERVFLDMNVDHESKENKDTSFMIDADYKSNIKSKEELEKAKNQLAKYQLNKNQISIRIVKSIARAC